MTGKELVIGAEGLKVDMCRMCLTTDPKLAHIYSGSGQMGCTIADAMTECTTVQISLDDGKPLYACKACYLKLLDAQKFKRMVLKSDAVLRTYLKQLHIDKRTVRRRFSIKEEQFDLDEARCAGQSSDELMITEDIGLDPANDITAKPESTEKIVDEISVDRNISNKKKQTETLISAEKVLIDDFYSGENTASGITSNQQETINTLEKINLNSANQNLEAQNDELLKNTNIIDGEILLDTNKSNDQEISGNASDDILVSDDAWDGEKEQDSSETEEETTSEEEEEDSASYSSQNKKKCEKIRNRGFKCKISKKTLSTKVVKTHKKTHNDDDRPFECTICDKKFKTKHDLVSHQRVHDDSTKSHKMCPICGKAIKYNLQIHLRRAHSDKKLHMCHKCGESFKELEVLRRHKEVHERKMVKCDICGKQLKGKQGLLAHKRNAHHGKEFKCSICFKIYSSRQTLALHKRRIHEEKRLECPDCEKTFSSAVFLKVHKQSTHRELKPFECEKCDKSFAFKINLISHLRIHSGEKPYKCNKCDNRFRRLDHFKLHLRQVHDKVSINYKCKVCDKKYKMKRDLDDHIQDVHNVPTHHELKPFECEKCDKSFDFKINLVSHLKIHSKEKPYKCNKCDNRFRRLNYLKLHLRNVHDDLDDHIQDVHNAPTHHELKPFECGNAINLLILRLIWFLI